MRDFLQNCCRKRIFFRYLQSERRQEVFPGRNSSAVEHFTRNEGVPSSNLGFGSKSGGCIAGCDLFFVCGRRRACRLPKDDCGTPRRPILCGLVGRTNAAGRQPGMEKPRNGRPEAYVVWQTTNPLISKKSGPRVAGIQAVSGEGPAPRGSVPLRRKAGGSRADRQLSAAGVAEYGVRRFKTDAHPALHTICRKRRSDRTSEREDFAVLISTRNPAGCKSCKNAKGRSSDSFRFRAFPA